jgi:hypothetical protein
MNSYEAWLGLAWHENKQNLDLSEFMATATDLHVFGLFERPEQRLHGDL